MDLDSLRRDCVLSDQVRGIAEIKAAARREIRGSHQIFTEGSDFIHSSDSTPDLNADLQVVHLEELG